jgi:hypothetical protein
VNPLDRAKEKILKHARDWFERPAIGSAFSEHDLTHEELDALSQAYPEGITVRKSPRGTKKEQA